MVNNISPNREYTGVCFEIGTVSRCKRYEINISRTCNQALWEEIRKREREERKG